MPPGRTRSRPGPSSSSHLTTDQPQKSRAELKKEWVNQYRQGKSTQEIVGSSAGKCVLWLYGVDFISPFADSGYMEILTSPRGGYMHVISNVRSDPTEDLMNDLILVPAKAIEQIFVIFDTSADIVPVPDGMLRVIIIPAGATCLYPLVKEYPEIIQFKWPNKKADDELIAGTATGHLSVKQSDTYISVLKSAFDLQLEPLGKRVRMCVKERSTVGGALIFKCPATLWPIPYNLITEYIQGSLLFLSTGILWFSHTILYFPAASIKFIFATLLSDFTDYTRTREENQVEGTIELFIPQALPKKGRRHTWMHVCFGVGQDFRAVQTRIQEYAKEVKIELEVRDWKHL